VLKTIFYSLPALVRKILFSPLEDKSHIFAPPCNILYISVHFQNRLVFSTPPPFRYKKYISFSTTIWLTMYGSYKIDRSHLRNRQSMVKKGISLGRCEQGKFEQVVRKLCSISCFFFLDIFNIHILNVQYNSFVI
jgi:hypothetical protein